MKTSELQVDKAVTAAQAWRLYRSSVKSLQALGFYAVKHNLGRSGGSSVRRYITFICSSKGVANGSSASLRHYAGVAELRLMLNVKSQDWRLTSVAEGYQIPDAEWLQQGNTVAIEFDAGEYSRTRLLEKVRNFNANYSFQIWGTSSPARVKVIQGMLDAMQVPGAVYFVDWTK